MIKLLDHIVPFLPGAIISSWGWHRLENLARALPSFSGVMLECRLGSGPAEIDFSVRANATDGGREILAGCHPKLQLTPRLLAAPEWQHIRNFCLEWRNSRSALHRHVENIWLEFDSGTHLAAAPLPCVFFDAAGVDGGDYAWIPDAALKILFSRTLAPAVKKNLMWSCDSLPCTASLHYVGAMLSRATEKIRLTVRISWQEVFDYFRIIAPEVRLDELRAATAWLRPHGESVVINLDAGQTVSPNVGIELSPDGNEAWRTLLEELTRKSFCRDDECKALLAWPGQSGAFEEEASSHKISLHASNYLDDSKTLVHVRRLNHVKLVYRQNRRPVAKAYLYVGYGWRHLDSILL